MRHKTQEITYTNKFTETKIQELELSHLQRMQILNLIENACRVAYQRGAADILKRLQ